MTTPAFSRGLLAAGLLLATLRCLSASPLDDLKSVSGISDLDARRLKNGEILSARGTRGSFARGVYIESSFFVRRPLAEVGAAFVQWDPTKHPEDEVAAYQLFRDPATVDYARVTQLKPQRARDRWMLEQSAAAKAGRAHDLHLTPSEAAEFRSANASAAWEGVLRNRAGAVAQGGLGAAAAYPVGDTTIAAQPELRGLLGMAPGIAARFAGVTGAAGGDRWFYAEQSPTQGHTSFSLGTITASAGLESWQIMDCTYYTADTYFMSADLYYLWDWEGGTLVWQVDYVSAPFRSYTGGLDKVFAGREMIKETAQSIETFRRAVGR